MVRKEKRRMKAGGEGVQRQKEREFTSSAPFTCVRWDICKSF